MYIFYILFTFFLIYYPPIFGVNSMYIVGLASWAILLYKYKITIKNINIKKFIKIYLFYIVILIYLIFVYLLNFQKLNNLNFIIYFLIFIFPASLVLGIYFKQKIFNFIDISIFIVRVSAIQSVLSILSFLFPKIQTFFIETLINYGYNEIFRQLTVNRMFGFSANLTSTTSMVQAVIAIIAIYISLFYVKRIVIYVPVIIFSAVLNTRTSLIIIIIGLLMVAVFSILKHDNLYNKIFKFISLFLVVFLSFFFLFRYMENSSSENALWLYQGWFEIKSFITGNSEGYFQYISNKNRYILPENYNLYFGKGIRIMGGGNSLGVYSDIGYINDIWLGGIVYSSVIYIFYITLFIDFLKKKNLDLRFFSIFIIVIIFVTNIKGNIFSSNDLMTLFYIYYFSFIVVKRKEDKNV